jgi:hypothetical protein
VALEAVKGERTLAELSSGFGVIPIRFANGEKQISRIPPGGTLKLIEMKIFNPKKFKKQIKEIIKLEVIPAY